MNSAPEKSSEVFESCPHCGQKLSPWQQVLLSVDHAIVCKNCWYRIIINVYKEEEKKSSKTESKNKAGEKDGVV